MPTENIDAIEGGHDPDENVGAVHNSQIDAFAESLAAALEAVAIQGNTLAQCIDQISTRINEALGGNSKQVQQVVRKIRKHIKQSIEASYANLNPIVGRIETVNESAQAEMRIRLLDLYERTKGLAPSRLAPSVYGSPTSGDMDTPAEVLTVSEPVPAISIPSPVIDYPVIPTETAPTSPPPPIEPCYRGYATWEWVGLDDPRVWVLISAECPTGFRPLQPNFHGSEIGKRYEWPCIWDGYGECPPGVSVALPPPPVPPPSVIPVPIPPVIVNPPILPTPPVPVPPPPYVPPPGLPVPSPNPIPVIPPDGFFPTILPTDEPSVSPPVPIGDDCKCCPDPFSEPGLFWGPLTSQAVRDATFKGLGLTRFVGITNAVDMERISRGIIRPPAQGQPQQ